jgi:hypothetical protein
VWYEAQSSGLGYQFLKMTDEKVQNVQQQPQLYPIVLFPARRALLRKFPYGLFYIIGDDRITIVACMHFHQNPRKLTSRIS